MFLFYHPEQTPKNLNYHKGRLFELLLRRYLEASGYEVELRRKSHSLEYDLTGRARLDGRELLGEAKAHGNPVGGHEVTSFVGKLVPRHARDPHLLGLFLSTSGLTAEADDYVSDLRSSNLHFREYSGDKLLLDITERLGLPTVATAQEAARLLGVYPLSTHMLVTEDGPHILVIAAADGGATPAMFSVVRADGQLVSDESFLSDLRARVQQLQELVPAFEPSSAESPRRSTRSPIPEGLILGNDWADYRLPAPPAYFVGRRELADRIQSTLTGDTHPGVVQLKSRSGVGKSSLMAFLAESLRASGVRVQLYDARDLKSVLDLWAVVQQFTDARAPAADFGDMERQLAGLAAQQGPRGVLLIDQFESTFSDPDLYHGFEILALAAVRARPHVCVVFARKNDLLTTFDDQQITLERLNEVSESLLLDDFSAKEAVQLIEAISAHADKPVAAELKAYVLEFAQGFPWLLKRTMAHVLNLLRQGRGPLELVSAALRLDDLFNEELAELDEFERDYLIRIARQLPATYHQLASYFDEDPYLPRVLDKLTRERLLRLSGSTYDTYNDVFKEYLVYRRLPEFRLSFVYRLGDVAVLGAFRRVAELRRFTTEEMQGTLRYTRGTTFNLIRELRNVSLLDRDAVGGWVVPDAVLDAYDRGRLGEYVRQSLVKNALVSDLLGHLQAAGRLTREELSSYLEKRFPFISASETTWMAYAANLIKWLRIVELVTVDSDAISLSTADRMESARRIGNLRHRPKTYHKVSPLVALPGSWWRHVETAACRLLAGDRQMRSRKERDGLADLVRMRLATPEGRLLAASAEEVRAKAARILSSEPYQSYWQAIKAGEAPVEALVRLFHLKGLQVSTVEWRAKLLLNWGMTLGLITPTERRFARVAGRQSGEDAAQPPQALGRRAKGKESQIRLEFPSTENVSGVPDT